MSRTLPVRRLPAALSAPMGLALILCLAPLGANAQSAPPEPTRTPVELHLQSLEVDRQGEDVVVAYEAEMASWRYLQELGVTPSFVVCLPGQEPMVDPLACKGGQRLSMTLQAPRAIVRHRLPTPTPQTPGAIVVATGHGPRHAIGYLRVGQELVQVPDVDLGAIVGPGPAAAPPTPSASADRRAEQRAEAEARATAETSGRAGLVDICREGTRVERDFVQCLKRARELPAASARQTVEACRAVSPLERDMLRCLELARPLGKEAPELVQACGRDAWGARQLHSCLEALTPPAPTVLPPVRVVVPWYGSRWYHTGRGWHHGHHGHDSHHGHHDGHRWGNHRDHRGGLHIHFRTGRGRR